MAPTTSVNSSAVTCKRCNKKLVNGLKCKNCENHFHSSCAKMCANVKHYDGEIICCEPENEVSEFDAAFYDAMDDIANTGNSGIKIDSKVFTYIIKQKDILIDELYDKIKLLNKQIELMDRINQNCQSDKKADKTEDKSDRINSAKTIPNKLKEPEPTVSKKPTISNTINPNKQGVKISGKSVSAELMKIETEQKCNEIINLVNDNPEGNRSLPSESFSKNNVSWHNVTYKNRRRRQMIVGNNTEVTVKGVPKYAILHVYRVDIETTLADFKDLLIHNFPEVIVEPISAKYPDLYNSYKVTIYAANFKRAMDPKVWPAGACVSRFFQVRKKDAPEK